MKNMICVFTVIALSSILIGETNYVWMGSPTPTAPYTSWATAAHTIQDAIDEASQGGFVLVTNGIYETGGRPRSGSTLTNRVLVTKRMTIKSVNGPGSTIILGSGPIGDGAVRCVFNDKATLSGFALSNGHTQAETDDNGIGGGVRGYNSSIITNCIISNCKAHQDGGGSWGCLLYSCTIEGNEALRNGGGTYRSFVYGCIIRGNIAANNGGGLIGYYDYAIKSCVIYGNSGEYGGGIYLNSAPDIIVEDCIIQGNLAERHGGGIYMDSQGGTLERCIILENGAGHDNTGFGKGGGIYNKGEGIINNCLIIENTADVYDLGGDGGGVYVETDKGIVRNSTIRSNNADVNGPDLYCNNGGTNLNSIIGYRWDDGNVSYRYCCLKVMVAGTGNITNDPQFIDPSAGDYRLKKTSACIDSGGNAYAAEPYDMKHTARIVNWTVDIGAYEYVPEHISSATDYYVSLSGNNVYPYTTSGNAAHTIQDAVEAAQGGDTVHVAEGIYSYGYQVIRGMKNRVGAYKPVAIIAENNDPAKTVITGSPDYYSGGTGTNAVRCVYMTNGAQLVGFTVQNGYTRDFGSYTYEQSGAGILCDYGGMISNCIVKNNTAERWGGGINQHFEGMVYASTCTGNAAQRGGGVRCYFNGSLFRCALTDNTAEYGGGVELMYGGHLRSCLLAENLAEHGGGIYFNNRGLSENATIAGNTATAYGGGVYMNSGGTNSNSIIYHNTAFIDENWSYNGDGEYFMHCCTYPLYAGVSYDIELTNDPAFVNWPGGDYRLSDISPCIDAGTNLSWMAGAIDLDGEPRIHDGTVDMGCYEFIPEPVFGIIGIVILGLFEGKRRGGDGVRGSK